mmetsp:Transcript_750/g.2103  ORF Transcript_750/g.2103 Transcript_750/m.2103 type:complete len:227 (+) Transcript_750:874-1554(+)
MISHALFVKPVLHGSLAHFETIEAPVERLWHCLWFLGQEGLQVLVFLRSGCAHSLARVPLQPLHRQVQARSRGVWVERRERYACAGWAHIPQKTVSVRVLRQPLKLLVRRVPEHTGDPANHINVVFAREQSAAPQDFTEDATHRPQVHRVRVLLRQKHHLWSPVPSCHDVLRQDATSLLLSGFVLRVEQPTAGQAEIANLQPTVPSQQNICRFQVAVRHTGRVDVG